MKYLHIPVLIASALLLYGLAVTVVDWLSLPLVAFNYDHECQWIQVPGVNGIERLECPTELPKRYDYIYVP